MQGKQGEIPAWYSNKIHTMGEKSDIVAREGPEFIKVDVEKIIAAKSPSLAKALPKFFINYIKRVIHQDQINYVLENYSHLPPVEFVRATLKYMEVSYTSVGIEKLDKNKRYIFAANHPFGGMDGMMFCVELHDYFGSGRIIINDLLMNVKPMAPLFIPINKHGRQSVGYMLNLKEALEAEGQIATFPAGLCSRRRKGVIRDLPWKPSFIKNAVSSQRDVVPVFFEGGLSDFFYGLSNVRTALGIKANIEMLYLPDEMFSQHGRHFNIIFGDPIPWQDLSEGGSAAMWAERIQGMAYDLKNK